ncbi:hypothetical protein QTP88_014802 [Uroleucon formosanum]
MELGRRNLQFVRSHNNTVNNKNNNSSSRKTTFFETSVLRLSRVSRTYLYEPTYMCISHLMVMLLNFYTLLYSSLSAHNKLLNTLLKELSLNISGEHHLLSSKHVPANFQKGVISIITNNNFQKLLDHQLVITAYYKNTDII